MELIFNENSRLNRLAKKMKRGDGKAASEIFDVLAPRVFGFCMTRLGRREIAEDVTQEIFLKLLKGIGSFSPEKGNFSFWFWSLARNFLTDYLREKKHLVFSDISRDAIESWTDKNETLPLTDKLEYERVLEFVNSLGNEERDLFEFHYIAEVSYKEMSLILGKSEGALRVSIVRLKKKIKEQFKNV